MAGEENADDEDARNQRELAEMNEITGAVKWPYEPITHFPEGMWKVGAIWDQAYYEAAEYIVTGVCKGDLNPYVHGAAGVFLFRHYVELALKYVLFYSRWLEDHSKNADEVVMFKKTHELNWLWERIKAELCGAPHIGLDSAKAPQPSMRRRVAGDTCSSEGYFHVISIPKKCTNT